jgi:hypothetical protein
MSYIGNSPTQSAFVTDLFNGDNSTTAFTMSVSPANPASILVAVSGVLQSPDTYSVSGRTLNFSAAPPSATGNISVRYLGIPASGVTTTAYRTLTEYTATAGQTTFTPPSYTVGFINVFRNGVMLGTADYTASNGTSVVLTNACTSGDLVVIESFYVSSVLNAIPATANAVNTLLISDGAITQSKLAAGVVGNGPAFRAVLSGNQTIPFNTYTKLTFNSEIFDTNNCYDSTTNYRFTPNVAGYYQVSLQIMVGGTASRDCLVYGLVYKNGSANPNSSGAFALTFGSGADNSVYSSGLIYMNGTTDYLESYMYQYDYTANSTMLAKVAGTNFNACLVRAA